MRKVFCSLLVISIVFTLIGCEKAIDIPEFSFYDEVELIDGENYADIVIDDLSKDTPEQDIKDLVLAISKEKKLDSLTLYSTYESYKANYSQSYKDLYPDALDNGLIVTFTDGSFDFTS